jgi:dienelactone hydrolase
MTMHKKAFIILFGILLLGVLGFLFYLTRLPLRSPVTSLDITQYVRILDKYAFARLQNRSYQSSNITIEKVLTKKPTYTAYLFSFFSDGKKVTGQLNLPIDASATNKKPVIVILRGYVDKEIYATGIGTRPAAEAFAQHGYITIAPDFLGYGGSDQESYDVFEARFEKPATVMNLFASLSTLPQANTKKIGVWGHSNGGQIAISVLEISKEPYPTVLWAPVTMKFPNSFLQFVDDLPDKGEYLKQQLATFHERYLDSDYDIDSHLKDIHGKIQLHQGTKDEAVPLDWSLSFVERMKELTKPITYFQYEGEDHNFGHGQWAVLVQRDLAFFDTELK